MSTEINGLSDVCLLKKLSQETKYVLTPLVNKSFEEGVFPKVLKLSRVIAIIKRVMFLMYQIITQYHNCLHFSKVMDKLLLIGILISFF